MRTLKIKNQRELHKKAGKPDPCLIQTQFRDTSRIYKTSGLLGFYGYQVKNQTNINQRYGLASISLRFNLGNL